MRLPEKRHRAETRFQPKNPATTLPTTIFCHNPTEHREKRGREFTTTEKTTLGAQDDQPTTACVADSLPSILVRIQQSAIQPAFVAA
jgi:hypothetical protein